MPPDTHPSEWLSGVGKHWAEQVWVGPPFANESNRGIGGRKEDIRVVGRYAEELELGNRGFYTGDFQAKPNGLTDLGGKILATYWRVQ